MAMIEHTTPKFVTFHYLTITPKHHSEKERNFNLLNKQRQN